MRATEGESSEKGAAALGGGGRGRERGMSKTVHADTIRSNQGKPKRRGEVSEEGKENMKEGMEGIVKRRQGEGGRREA